MSFSLQQQRVLALLPKVTGFTSLFFSALIVTTILRDKSRRRKIYHRLLLGISLCDASASFWLALSTWPIPSSHPSIWAAGNEATCRAQGFFTQFGISSSFYNASLSCYYLLVIRFNYKEHELRYIEWALHSFPLLWATCSAVAGLALDVYDNAFLWCWVAAKEETFRWAAFYGPLWTMIIIVSLNCILIFDHVRRVERTAQRHRWVEGTSSNEEGGPRELSPEPRHERPAPSSSSGEPQRTLPVSTSQHTLPKREDRKMSRRTKLVANQSFMYAGAFYFNWAFLTTTRLIQTIDDGKVYFPLLVLSAISVPVQGLPNFIVYLGPKFRQMRKDMPQAGVWKLIRNSLARRSDSQQDDG